MLIAVPHGIKVFRWLATLWGASSRLIADAVCPLAACFNFVFAGVNRAIQCWPRAGGHSEQHPILWWALSLT